MSASTIDGAKIQFLARKELYDHEKPHPIQFESQDDVIRSNVSQVLETVTVRDIRQTQASLDFDKDGFVIGRLVSKMSYKDSAVPEKVKSVYLEEVKALPQDTLGIKNVAVLQYPVRRRHKEFPITDGEDFDFTQPVATAHIDFSPDCLVEIIKDRYDDKADELLKHHYQIANVWKPLHGPLRDWSLALCKPTSVDVVKDLQPMDRVYAANIEELIQIHFNPQQE